MYPCPKASSSWLTLAAMYTVSTVTRHISTRTTRATVKILRPIESRRPLRTASVKVIAAAPSVRAEGVIPLAVGEPAAVGGDPGAVELELGLAIARDPKDGCLPSPVASAFLSLLRL